MSGYVHALPLTISEAAFQELIVRYAKARGWRLAHFLPAINLRGRWATHMQGHPGFPDLVLARAGVVLVREVKRHGGRLEPAQRDWQAALGDLFDVWRPTDWTRIREELA